MESSVSLQEPFSYAIWPIVVAGALVLTALIYWGIVLIRKKLSDRPQKPVVRELGADDKDRIRKKYIGELDAIGADFDTGRLDIRHAYQKMSMCIRRFVHEMTGIKVQNYTLCDIGTLGIPDLYSLVAEYYAPEFARKSEGDVRNSLARTRSTIERWI